jgi:putative transposase
MNATKDLAASVGTAAACRALGVPRATLYRQRHAPAQPLVEAPARPAPPLKLTALEQARALEMRHSARFVDASPYTVYATLLDEGEYVGSVRTLYRLLEQAGENTERRRVRTPTGYVKPERLATGPNQLWSWDITKLKGPQKWTYFYLYVIIDVFSRCVVGWTVATRESSELAKLLFQETCEKHGIAPDQLTVHADRGASMTSKCLAQLFADLGITKTHSRPYTSDDNPFSEAHFKTLKYRPDFPARFGCLEDARAHCRAFFDWYNQEHRHAGIAFMTPAAVHAGQVAAILETRSHTLEAAFDANPSRFKGRCPTPQQPPEAVWINPPAVKAAVPEQPQESSEQA